MEGGRGGLFSGPREGGGGGVKLGMGELPSKQPGTAVCPLILLGRETQKRPPL